VTRSAFELTFVTTNTAHVATAELKGMEYQMTLGWQGRVSTVGSRVKWVERSTMGKAETRGKERWTAANL
jgi:hypothetical protein